MKKIQVSPHSTLISRITFGALVYFQLPTCIAVISTFPRPTMNALLLLIKMIRGLLLLKVTGSRELAEATNKILCFFSNGRFASVLKLIVWVSLLIRIVAVFIHDHRRPSLQSGIGKLLGSKATQVSERIVGWNDVPRRAATPQD